MARYSLNNLSWISFNGFFSEKRRLSQTSLQIALFADGSPLSRDTSPAVFFRCLSLSWFDKVLDSP